MPKCKVDQRHPALSKEESLQIYKQEAAIIARQLCYKPAIIAAIHSAESESEITVIMRTARESI